MVTFSEELHAALNEQAIQQNLDRAEMVRVLTDSAIDRASLADPANATVLAYGAACRVRFAEDFDRLGREEG